MLSLPGLTFDPVEHAYHFRGSRVPSVTQVLKDLRVSPPYPADRGQLEFGRAMHKACELRLLDRLALGACDEDKYPGTDLVLWPYLDAFGQKVYEYKIKPKNVELIVYNDLRGYAGQLDVHCAILENQEALIDYKSGMPPECTGLQLAAYDMALNRILGLPERHRPRRRFALYLFEDEVKQTGRARMIEFTDPFDYEAFLGMVAHWKWKNKKGVPLS